MHVRYHCDFCPPDLAHGSENADAILDHEPVCEYNPAAKCCCTCVHQEFTPEYRGRKRPFVCAILNDREYRHHCPKWELRPAAK